MRERGGYMKKTLIILMTSVILFLSGCKEEETIETPDPFLDDGRDISEMVITIDEAYMYNIAGKILYHSENDFNELYLMMYPNTHYEGSDRVTINDLSIDGEDVIFQFDGVDRSAIKIILNQPISDGDTISIEYDMDVIYPNTFRIAHYGDMIYQMYFYPFVAMYDGEFDIDPYAERGETYYNTLYNYDVTIKLDEDFIVAAPGDYYYGGKEDSMKTHRYMLEDARDFSFSASTYYEVYEWTADEKEFSIYSIRDLSSQELMETKEYVRKSFEVYESYLGDYYYDHFILELGYIYGMESTGIIFCSEEIDEITVVHEVIHQWFFFMVSNDSYNESFLDESLTTYITALYLYDLYGMEGYNGYLDYRNSDQERFEEHWTNYGGTSLLDTVDEIGEGYGFVIYYHGPSLFREYVRQFLDNDVEEFARIVKVYFEEFDGEIATIDEFLTILENESGVSGTKDWFYFHLNSLQDVNNSPQ